MVKNHAPVLGQNLPKTAIVRSKPLTWGLPGERRLQYHNMEVENF